MLYYNSSGLQECHLSQIAKTQGYILKHISNVNFIVSEIRNSKYGLLILQLNDEKNSFK